MTVRFGVIGANVNLRGGIVFKYFPAEDGELAAICERDPAMVAKFRETYPDWAELPVYEDYRDLLKHPDLDAVFVMVRDQYHEEMAVAALEAGKAVYLEKPMAITLEGCDRILETAYRTGRYKTFAATLQVVEEICQLAICLSDGELEALSWSDFVSGIDREEKPELIEYLKTKRLYVNENLTESEEM